MSTHTPNQITDWVAADGRHVWHPYTQMHRAEPPLAITHAKGVYLYTASGKRILDGTSSWWVNLHGHNHPRLNRAIAEQLDAMAQVVFAGITHEPASRLAQALAAATPGNLNRVFFSDDGSTAVEVALKMAYQYQAQTGHSGRTRFVALEHAFHGDTFGAMATSGVRLFRDTFGSLLFDVARIPSPACGHQRKPCSQCGVDAGDALEALLAAPDHNIAALIIEPMLQGAGGMLVWPPSMLARLRDITRRHGVLLIADEVLSGFGRTGKLFACEHGPIAPDLMCLSKGLTGGYLPLGATLATDEIFAAFLAPDVSRALLHGHSFTGNALSCRVALASLALFEEESTLERIGTLEKSLGQRLAVMAKLPRVKYTRHIGGMAALELDQGTYGDDLAHRLGQALLAKGLLLRPLGPVLYVLPPYAIQDDQLDELFDGIEAVLRQL